jgi:hypothetical protein
METAGDPEMLTHINQTILCHILQDSYLWPPPSEPLISRDHVRPKIIIFSVIILECECLVAI